MVVEICVLEGKRCAHDCGLWVVHPRFVPRIPQWRRTAAPKLWKGGRREGWAWAVFLTESGNNQSVGGKGLSEEGLWKWLAAADEACPHPYAFMSLPFLLCETRLQEAVSFIRPFSISVWLKSLSAAETAETHTLVFIKYCASSCLNHSPYISNKTLH